ncbi:hypothetical protein B0T14DRAFT_220918 [Immersiella caudata]|uniref:Uncharacterized protein n=1 Tax=Immersiella caudata TaxID=314043 RepID=A0AA39WR54_9PEZI|nr:hypothetical protein B0T14DRAFT_220918 [Immersiella caudata]
MATSIYIRKAEVREEQLAGSSPWNRLGSAGRKHGGFGNHHVRVDPMRPPKRPGWSGPGCGLSQPCSPSSPTAKASPLERLVLLPSELPKVNQGLRRTEGGQGANTPAPTHSIAATTIPVRVPAAALAPYRFLFGRFTAACAHLAKAWHSTRARLVACWADCLLWRIATPSSLPAVALSFAPSTQPSRTAGRVRLVCGSCGVLRRS